MVEQEKIKLEAKTIMDNFMKALSGIDVENEFVLNRKKTFRLDNGKSESSDEFRNIFLQNANKKTPDAILANKGEWEK